MTRIKTHEIRVNASDEVILRAHVDEPWTDLEITKHGLTFRVSLFNGSLLEFAKAIVDYQGDGDV